MPNLRIIADNAADRATSLVATTAAAGLPASNMQTDRKTQVCRSTGTSVTYTLTWAAGESIGGVSLPATNMTGDAIVRVRLYGDTACTALLADSGAIYACQGLDLALWDWAQPLNVNAFSYGGVAKTSVWFDLHYNAKGCIVDLVDAGNPAGYIDCARIVAGAWWSPENNPTYGLQAGVTDNSVVKRTDADDVVAERRTLHDTLSLDLSYMPESDRARLRQIILSVGTSRNLLVSVLPGNGNNVTEQDATIFGHRAANASPFTFDLPLAYSNKIDLEGW